MNNTSINVQSINFASQGLYHLTLSKGNNFQLIIFPVILRIFNPSNIWYRKKGATLKSNSVLFKTMISKTI